ncbi:beta-1,4-galactosyltransferase 1-like [Acanthochromis polyacanthus]|uniref:beta-1,4-galactosyltransferase 1-like n=1 Tax=Acanthochromis polyacanthus TaxID=80966 RepID=UPI002234DE79|nr:beta-1,4-galactosyltransferase 1-like [Acanthochromis polyacanthus]
MRRKLFTFLTALILLSLVFLAEVIFDSKNSFLTSLAFPYPVPNRKHTFFWKVKETEDPQVTQGTTQMQDPKVSQGTTHTSTNKTLGPCTDPSPKLLGPLQVEFNLNLTLEEVRKKISRPLQEGGRYKPPDCIATQKVAIIIPFRNRHEHLKHWLYFLHPMLMRQQLDYGVYVINQDGVGVFNRAKLMNVGYVEALKQYDYDCFVFSDVDLVPLDDRNIYKCFDNPRHLSVAIDKHNFHLPYRTYYGGVSSLFKDQFLKINGFPNNYWGWGGEDDDIYKRIVFRGMSISRPDSKIGRYKMIKHRRDLHNEANPKNHGILRRTKSTMDVDGINSLNYTVKEIVKDALYTFITVDIQAPANYKNI